MILEDNPLAQARKKGVLLAAHRGTCGGNIVQNTIQSYENALKHGADILEIDIARTTDGAFFVFHTGQEPHVIGTNQRLDSMTSDQVLSYRLINSGQEVTAQRVNRLDDVLEHFKGRCLINIDRSWYCWEEVIRHLAKKGMADQLILKSPAEPTLLRQLEESRTGLMYMPVIRDRRELSETFRHKLNTVAAEIIFTDHGQDLAQPQFIEEMHGKGLLLWVNAITLDDQKIMSGGHDDNHAILRDMDEGWGWLLDRGFDILQTDWPLLLKCYIAQSRKGT